MMGLPTLMFLDQFKPEEGEEESEEQPVTKSEVKEDVKSTEDVSAAFDDLFNN